jgi:hypothetical protein
MRRGGWVKSSRCDNDLCVEVCGDAGVVQVRASDVPGQVLTFAPADWRAAVAEVRAGRWDRP